MRVCNLFRILISSHNVKHLSVYISFTSCFPFLFIIAEAKLSLKLLSSYTTFFYSFLAWSFGKIWADNLGDLPLLLGLEGRSTNTISGVVLISGNIQAHSQISTKIHSTKRYILLYWQHIFISVLILYLFPKYSNLT